MRHLLGGRAGAAAGEGSQARRGSIIATLVSEPKSSETKIQTRWFIQIEYTYRCATHRRFANDHNTLHGKMVRPFLSSGIEKWRKCPV